MSNHNNNKLNAPGNGLDRGSSSLQTRSPSAALPLSASLGRIATRVPLIPDLNLMPDDSPPPETSPTPGRSWALTLDVESNSLAFAPVPDHQNHQDNKEQDRCVFKRTRMIYDSLLLHLTVDKASGLMKELNLSLNQGKVFVGSVPGVEIGDMFLHRNELFLFGLHRRPQAGIDNTTAKSSPFGVPIVTSIVVSGGYEDNEDSGDKLIYSGQGGRDSSGRQIKHQKLEGANQAMVNSMDRRVDIRVIRGFKYDKKVSSKVKVFVYDGLYRVVTYSLGRAKSSEFDTFKFTLERIQGQAELGSAIIKRAETLRRTPLNAMPDRYISFDLYGKKKGVPVYLYNDIDFDRSPLKYQYIAQSAISSVIPAQGNIGGCDCKLSCTDDCLCVRKNGGELPYTPDGRLLRGKPVIFECGVGCKCTSSCANRVAQLGLRKKMEVFRTRESSWGVRPLDLIHAGEFICEYAGVMVTKEQAETMSMNEDSLVYPGRFAEKWKLWGDLSDVYPGYVPPPSYPTIPPIEYAMDVSKFRSVAAFIRHSKEPNVMAQFVFHDHNDLKFPRIMLFALENISPLTELSLDYVLVDEVGETLAIGG